MFFWFGLGALLEPLIMGITLGLVVAAAPVFTRTPRGLSGLKLYMGLTVLGYALIIYALLKLIDVNLTLISLAVIIAAMAIFQYLISPFIINAFYNAREADVPWLVETVRELARRANVKPPKVMIVESPVPNAFAYGSILAGRYVAVTTGLLNSLSKEEIKAVLGHELGHLKHRDVIIIMSLAIVPMVVYYIGRILMDWGWLKSLVDDREDKSGIYYIAIGAVLLAFAFLLNFILLQFSRLREYFADAHGAKLAGKRNMQRALARLYVKMNEMSSDPRVVEEVRRFVESPAKMLLIYAFVDTFNDIDEIVEMLKHREERGLVATIKEIFSTHPPIPKRIRFLESIQTYELKEA